MTMHKRVIEAIRAEVCARGAAPNALYLGRHEEAALRAEIKDATQLFDFDGLESVYAGLRVYPVDAEHHFNVTSTTA